MVTGDGVIVVVAVELIARVMAKVMVMVMATMKIICIIFMMIDGGK